MEKKFHQNTKLYTCILLGLLVPPTYFTATTTGFNSYVFFTLFKSTIVVFIIATIFSLIVKIFTSKDFIALFSSSLFFISIFFFYSNILEFTVFLLNSLLSNIHEELAFFVTIFLGFLFFYFLMKRERSFINFLFIFLPLVFFINLYNSINLYLNKTNYNFPIFSEDNYFDDLESSSISSNNKNKNIYFILLDGAINLENFEKKLIGINKDKIYKEFETLGLKKIDNVNSEYSTKIIDLNTLGISEMFNLNKFDNLKYIKLSDKNVSLSQDVRGYKIANVISPDATFPTIIANFDKTALGKTLKKINYNFVWVGSVESDCIYFKRSLCLKDKLNLKSYLKHLVNFDRLYKSNYVLRNYLQLTPLIKINNKVNQLDYIEDLSIKQSQYQIDGIKRFIDYSKFNNEKTFNFIHFGLPKIHVTNKRKPILLQNNCSFKNSDKQLNFSNSFRSIERIHLLDDNEFKNLYVSNYLCMIKRIKEFVKYINLNDPTGLIMIQSGLNFPVEVGREQSDRFELLTYLKVPQTCEKSINSNLDNINSVRFLLSCATDKKFRSYKSDDS